MKTFGQALQALRESILGKRSALKVATVVLGENSAEKKRRDFANYMGRIERDEVPSVGLGQLRLIAKGLGFVTLTPFFARIEAEMEGVTQIGGESDKNPHSGKTGTALKRREGTAVAGVKLAESSERYDRDSLSAAGAEAHRVFLTRLATAITAVLAVDESGEQTPTPRGKSARRVKSDRANR